MVSAALLEDIRCTFLYARLMHIAVHQLTASKHSVQVPKACAACPNRPAGLCSNTCLHCTFLLLCTGFSPSSPLPRCCAL